MVIEERPAKQLARTTRPQPVEGVIRRIQELEKERDQLNDQLWRAKGRSPRLMGVVMLLVGTIVLVSVAVYTVTVLAFIGLCLTFCGAFLLQLRPAIYLKAELHRNQ